MKKGRLILLPNLLDPAADMNLYLPASTSRLVASLQGLIAESEKEGRLYLRRFLTHEEMKALPIKLLNEHTKKTSELDELLSPMVQGETWGLISDAGLSCIADPGSDLVAKARQKEIELQTISGPSSLIMALQLSGFTGQKFTFHGYLPKEPALLEKTIVEIEKKSRFESSSQIWIEAPYRSAKMLSALIALLQPSTKLCVAASLTGPNQRCLSLSISAWKECSFALEKEPCIFILRSI